MFKVKRKNNQQTYQVLDTYLDLTLQQTYFLIWENDNWRWRPADKFVPPNYKKEKQNE